MYVLKPNIHILTFLKPANYWWMCAFYSTSLIAFLFYARGLSDWSFKASSFNVFEWRRNCAYFKNFFLLTLPFLIFVLVHNHKAM